MFHDEALFVGTIAWRRDQNSIVLFVVARMVRERAAMDDLLLLPVAIGIGERFQPAPSPRPCLPFAFAIFNRALERVLAEMGRLHVAATNQQQRLRRLK
jgi:hypothetical protein